MTNACQQPDLFPARMGLYLIAVRVDGRRSHVEPFSDFDAMMEAGKQWCYNSEIAWVSLNVAGSKTYPPEQTHILVRRGDEVLVREQSARTDRVGRSKVRSGRAPAALG